MRKGGVALLGVDILEREKARSFYRAHKDRLAQILNTSELEHLKNVKNKPDALAEMLAAKEAVFKAIGGSWMGLSGFKKISLSFKRDGSVRSGDLRITFKKNKDYVVACAGI